MEDVAQVGLDCLWAEDQLRGDLGVGFAVGDEPCHLQFAFGEGLKAGCAGLAWPGAPVDAMAELSQLALCLVAVAPGAAGVELCGGALKLAYGTLGLAGMLLLFVHAYSMGGGTYTGIEAVSNGVAILREPRVATGKRTMVYMAVSLAVMAGGLLLCYMLSNVKHVEGPNALNFAFMDALASLQFPACPDFNGPNPEGYGRRQGLLGSGERQSTAKQMLRPALARGNIHVQTDAQVARVVVENGRATGVELTDGRVIKARR